MFVENFQNCPSHESAPDDARSDQHLTSNIQHPRGDASPRISVIVPCYNSARTIRDCLRAIFAQRTDAAYEVIVVDSSTDATPEIVAREFPEARLIHFEERRFAGAARNAGARAARASICLMIDSDCVARPDLIERVLARHAEDRYAAVGGSLANGTPRSLSGWIGYLVEFKEFMPSTPERLEKTIPTANIAYRRDLFFDYGGFDEDMWLAEDILFNWKLHRAGERILFDPRIEVTHLNRTGWREVLSYQVHMGRLSAEARRRGGLPGAFLLRRPWLVALMPFVRTWRAFQWFARHDRRTLAAFLFVWPLYLLACAYWSVGFFREARRRPAASLSAP